MLRSITMDIDWNEQWSLHAKNFFDGLAHISLDNNQTLLLHPGPGFGEGTHPTTCGALLFLSKYCKDQNVLDIGCGSGILSIGAHLLGAKRCWGCDIDPQAILHAKTNALLNHCALPFYLPDQLLEASVCPSLIVMNMIFSEQQAAMAYYPPFTPQLIITSGIRIEYYEQYIEWTKTQGWKLLENTNDDGWVTSIFTYKESI